MSLGLETARALVVDNDYKEARPVLLALSHLRIGSVYLNGDVELVDETKGFRGVRLALVDMDLQGDGGTSAEEQGAQAAEYVARAISPDNGILAVLIWTKHKDAAETFLSELGRHMSGNAILHVGTMEKPAQEDGAWEGAAKSITNRIRQTIGKSTGLRLLLQWEQLAHDAANETSRRLVEVISKNHKIDLASLENVSKGLTQTLGVLSAGAQERPAKSGLEAASHAFQALLPILQDGAEQASWGLEEMAKEELTDLLEIATDPNKVGGRAQERKAALGRLNRMIHLSRQRDGNRVVLPGNVYELEGSLVERSGFKKELLLESVTGNGYKSDIGGSEPELVLVEVSPACDYAQGKIEVPRVVGGALVPVERLKKANSSEYLYSACGILKFDDNEVEGVDAGAYHFILNARFLSGVSKGVLSRRVPLFRVRQQTLVDVQAWLARQGNRPGVITVRG